MTNAELIKALRNCSCIKNEDHCKICGYRHSTECGRRIADDAAAALEAAEQQIAEQQKQIAQLYMLLNNRINEIAELEAQLPKEGEWIEVHDWLQIPQEERGTYRCSACGQVMKYPWNYCPNCGAKMDGADGERRTE